MNWTTEYPTKAGYYWARKLAFKYNPQAVTVNINEPKIVSIDQCLEMHLTEDQIGPSRKQLISAEWYGPITPPES